MIQGSEEWFAERRGKVTSSRVADIVRRTKSGPAASRANYMAELIIERLTNTTAPSYMSPAMQWGADTEAQARDAYAFATSLDVEEVGFINHPTIPMCGGSPDGLMGSRRKRGIIEIKCPSTATHLEYLDSNVVPTDYLIQMQWNMACVGANWGHFVSFDPRLPLRMQLVIIPVEQDAEDLGELTDQVKYFLQELDKRVASYCERFDLKPKLEIAA